MEEPAAVKQCEHANHHYAEHRLLLYLSTYARLASQKEAAHELGVKRRTLRNVLGAAYCRLGVEGHLDAFRALGWLQVP